MSQSLEHDRVRDESNYEDTTPLVGGDKTKPQSKSITGKEGVVANRENFHVHGLYPPLSLGKEVQKKKMYYPRPLSPLSPPFPYIVYPPLS